MGVQEQPRGRVSADLITTLCAGEGASVALRTPCPVLKAAALPKASFPCFAPKEVREMPLAAEVSVQKTLNGLQKPASSICMKFRREKNSESPDESSPCSPWH